MLMDSSNGGSTLSEKDWPALLRDSSRTGGQNSQAFRKPVGARWQAKVDGNVRTAPILRDGFLYVTSLSGYLHAIDVATGRLGWKYSVLGYTIASYVAASRLHDNRHYLSDVVFGAAVGAIAGRTVTEHGRDVWTFTPTAVPGGGIAVLATRTAR